MDSDANKIFVGGISWETTDEKLKEYFETYGSVVEAVIMKDRTTGRGRGFGFVVFADAEVADRVVQDKHHINGKAVEAKKAVPKDENQNPSRGGAGNVQPSGGGSGGSSSRTKKIFVGGLAPSVTEEEFRAYFEQFGSITDVVVMYDHATQRPRGFGFITFDSEEAVDNVLQKTFHELKGKMVEVKRAVPKDASAPARSPTSAAFPRGPFAAAAAAAAYGQGFAAAAGPYAYGPRAYPSYAGYAGYGYGYAGYGAGAYSPAGATGYGAAAAGYGGATGSYAPAAGRSSWPNYGTSSPGYGGNGGSMSAYGAGGTAGWASPQQTTQGSGSYGGGYSYAAAGNDGNGSGGGGGYSYGAAAAARTGGYAAGGYGAGNAAPGYGGGGSYSDGYAYQQDNSWRSAEAYSSTVQSGTPAGYGSSSAAAESGAGNGAAGSGGYGGYGSRQTQRGDLFLE